MMKYRKTGKFKLGFLTLLLSVLFVACGSGASDADRQIKSKTDLKGAVIGVQLGTTSDGLATELEKEGGGTKVERYNKGADAIQALLQGKIDCMVTDEAPAKAFQRVNPSLRILPETFDASSFAICVAKDHAELQKSINHAICILKENGVIDSIVNRRLEDESPFCHQRYLRAFRILPEWQDCGYRRGCGECHRRCDGRGCRDS